MIDDERSAIVGDRSSIAACDRKWRASTGARPSTTVGW
jgi:hypothetical protein